MSEDVFVKFCECVCGNGLEQAVSHTNETKDFLEKISILEYLASRLDIDLNEYFGNSDETLNKMKIQLNETLDEVGYQTRRNEELENDLVFADKIIDAQENTIDGLNKHLDSLNMRLNVAIMMYTATNNAWKEKIPFDVFERYFKRKEEKNEGE